MLDMAGHHKSSLEHEHAEEQVDWYQITCRTAILTDTAADERMHEARVFVDERFMLFGRCADLEEDGDCAGAVWVT